MTMYNISTEQECENFSVLNIKDSLRYDWNNFEIMVEPYICIYNAYVYTLIYTYTDMYK